MDYGSRNFEVFLVKRNLENFETILWIFWLNEVDFLDIFGYFVDRTRIFSVFEKNHLIFTFFSSSNQFRCCDIVILRIEHLKLELCLGYFLGRVSLKSFKVAQTICLSSALKISLKKISKKIQRTDNKTKVVVYRSQMGI